LWGALHYGRYSPVGFAERPEPNLAALTFDASASMQGSRALVADAQAPAWWEGWRAALTVTAARDNRLGFYGLGNDTRYFADSAAGASPHFYKVSRTHTAARVTIQRRIAGPLRVLAGAALERTSFRTLPGDNVFRRALASGAVDPATVPFTDKVARAGIVLDARDHEIDPHRGVLLEALFASGTGYTRTTVHARVFVDPVERLVLAARLAGEGLGGRPPIAARLTMESSELPFTAVGGYRSLRGFYDARFVGRGKLLGSLEARYAMVLAPTILELKLVAFYDVGRVFDAGERWRLTSEGLHRSGGGELGLRFLRNSLICVGYGRGSEGGHLLFGTTWSY
jgi:outer membrane protein assembly factor BamA